MPHITTEFTSFIRDAAIRALDQLEERSKDVSAKLRPLLKAWSKLAGEAKVELLDELIGYVHGAEPEEPAPRPKKKTAAKKKPAAKKKARTKAREENGG
jgi:hypothetical protein